MHRIEGQNFIKDSQGRNIFTDGPPPTTLPAAFMNSVQEEIATVIETAGLQLATQATDNLKNQLYNAILSISSGSVDNAVSSQAQLNDLIERIGANQYQFKGTVRSIFLKRDPNGTGYLMSGTSSFLSGGDTWGELQTNNCGYIFCENDAFFNVGIERSYFKMNTDNAMYTGIRIVGDTASSAAITYGFDVSGSNIAMYNCGVKLRNTTTGFSGFDGNNIKTNKYIGCHVTNIQGTNTVNGFHQCYNLDGCYLDTLSTANSALNCIRSSVNVKNCVLLNMSATGTGTVYGVYLCENINNCELDNFDTVNGDCRGFYDSDNISNCTLNIFDSTGTGNLHGFNTCNRVNNCQLTDFDTTGVNSQIRGFTVCDRVLNCDLSDFETTHSGGAIYGFFSCENISNFTVDDLIGIGNIWGMTTCNNVNNGRITNIEVSSGVSNAQAYGNCDYITTCYCSTIDADSGNAYGFSSCKYISSCYTNDIDANSGDSYGFTNSTYLTACYANDIDSVSGNSYGFQNCQYGSSLNSSETTNPNCDYIDTDDAAITNKYSCNRTMWT